MDYDYAADDDEKQDQAEAAQYYLQSQDTIEGELDEGNNNIERQVQIEMQKIAKQKVNRQA